MEESPPVPKQEDALTLALGVQILAIASRPVTPGMLLELEQTARLARELLVVGKNTQALMPRHGAITMDPMAQYVGGDYTMPAFSTPTETFGAQLIREVVPLLGSLVKPKEESPPPAPVTLHQSPLTDLMGAIELAKRNDPPLEALLRQELCDRVFADKHARDRERLADPEVLS